MGDLESPNAMVKKEAIQRISKGPSFPMSLICRRWNRGNEKKAVAIMVKMLRSGKESKDVELDMLKAIAKLGKGTEVPVSPLIEKLRDGDPQIRVQVAEALARTRTREASTALLEVLEEEGLERYTIIWALGETGTPEAVPALNRLLTSEDKYVRYNARRALAKIKEAQHQEENESNARRVLDIVGWPIKAFKKYREAMMVVFQKIEGFRRADGGTKGSVAAPGFGSLGAAVAAMVIPS